MKGITPVMSLILLIIIVIVIIGFAFQFFARIIQMNAVETAEMKYVAQCNATCQNFNMTYYFANYITEHCSCLDQNFIKNNFEIAANKDFRKVEEKVNDSSCCGWVIILHNDTWYKAWNITFKKDNFTYVPVDVKQCWINGGDC